MKKDTDCLIICGQKWNTWC